jgi:hypothetical protein
MSDNIYNKVQSLVNDLAVNLENTVRKDRGALNFLLTDFIHNIFETGLFGDSDFANLYAQSLLESGKTLDIGTILLGVEYSRIEQTQEQEASTKPN